MPLVSLSLMMNDCKECEHFTSSIKIAANKRQAQSTRKCCAFSNEMWRKKVSISIKLTARNEQVSCKINRKLLSSKIMIYQDCEMSIAWNSRERNWRRLERFCSIVALKTPTLTENPVSLQKALEKSLRQHRQSGKRWTLINAHLTHHRIFLRMSHWP